MSGIGTSNDHDISAADGITDDFTFTFFAYDTDVVKVYSVLDDVLTPITTGITITVNSDYNGGNVHFDTPPAALVGDILRRREEPYTQLQQFSDLTGRFRERAYEQGLNKLEMQIQQVNSKASRALSYTEAAGVTDATIETPQDGKALIFDGTTGRLIAGPDAADITIAQTYATNAASSASAAATSESNAALSAAAAAASAAGMTWRPPVRVATTANITLSGTQTIDGVSAIVGDRVLVKDQSTASQNGVYVVSSGAWSRATDADTWAELVSQCVVVSEGTANADFFYVCTVNAGGTLGSTSVAWSTISFVATNSVDNTKLADMAANTVKVRSASSSGDPSDLALSASQVLGRGSSGDIAALSFGSGITVTGSTIDLSPGPNKLLGSVSASNAPTVDFSNLLSSTYDQYVIEMYNVYGSVDSVGLNLRAGTGAGPTWLVTNEYDYTVTAWRAGTSTSDNTSNSGASALTVVSATANYGIGNAATAALGGEIKIGNANGSRYKDVEAHIGGRGANGNTVNNIASGAITTTTALTSLRLLATSGNLYGEFKLYGISK